LKTGKLVTFSLASLIATYQPLVALQSVTNEHDVSYAESTMMLEVSRNEIGEIGPLDPRTSLPCGFYMW
jgi:hypothetical protein